MSKIRRRRETSADITIFRKSNETVKQDNIARMLRHDSVDSREDNVGGQGGYKHQDISKHQLYRSKMETTAPFPASPLTSPDTLPPASVSPCIMTQEPLSPRNTPSPSIMTQTPDPGPPRTTSPSMMTQTPPYHTTPVENRSLNSSNSKDSSGCQPCSENLDSKGRMISR